MPDSKQTTPQPAGLYVHIPFCRRKCPYCDFYSLADSTRLPQFCEALMREMTMADRGALTFDTLYFGGGTPSLLSSDRLAEIVAAAQQTFRIAERAQITLEMNPGTVTPRGLDAYRRAGINRLNIGLQSLDDRHLRFLGRIHTAEQGRRAFHMARVAGFDNLGVDLIYGLPGQTRQAWEKELDRTLALNPEHIACYLLTYEPGTPLTAARDQNRFAPLTEEQTAGLFRTTAKTLIAGGYAHYEISNFARISSNHISSNQTGSNQTGSNRTGAGPPLRYRSRHNSKYWQSVPYLGLGPAAHSFVGGERWWNHRNLKQYLLDIDQARLPIAEVEQLSDSQQMMETIYLQLRTAEGINLAAYDQTFGPDPGSDFRTRYAEIIALLCDHEWAVYELNNLRLTLEGMLRHESVAGLFL